MEQEKQNIPNQIIFQFNEEHLEKKAITISLLDSKIEYEDKDSEEAKKKKEKMLSDMGSRWTPEFIDKRSNSPDLESKITKDDSELLMSFLKGERGSKEWLFAEIGNSTKQPDLDQGAEKLTPEQPRKDNNSATASNPAPSSQGFKKTCISQYERNTPNTLKGFLDDALFLATKYSEKSNQEQQLYDNAGSIYLYNSKYDELVMAASHNFPLMNLNKKKLEEFYKQIGEEQTTEGQTTEEQTTEEQNRILNQKLYIANLFCLKHINEILKDGLPYTTIPLSPWVPQKLKEWHAPFSLGNDLDIIEYESTFEGLDTNEILPGIAHYRPGNGITGRLFDPQKGADLEHEQISDITDQIKNMMKGIPEKLKNDLIEEQLGKRTIVFKRRDDMSVGRQVKAGIYEGLQYPSSDYIGPFLGTVLRFNGEHLGIIKVERYRKNLPKQKDDIPHYTAEEVKSFLLYAYSLSGVLYILKHHSGIDLCQAWTNQFDQPRKGEYDV